MPTISQCMFFIVFVSLPTLLGAIRVVVMSVKTLHCEGFQESGETKLCAGCCAMGLLVGWRVAVGSLRVSLSGVDCIAAVAPVRTATPG